MNWKLLIVDLDTGSLPKGWITAIAPGDHEFSDYERTSGIWKIIDTEKRPYPIPASDISPDIEDICGDWKRKRPRNFAVENNRPIEKKETVNEIIAKWNADKIIKPLPIPNHLDRSRSVIWDYGPGRTYSTPQAAYDALYLSVLNTTFTENHYIRGWSGTYGVVGSNVLYLNPRVEPRSRENKLIFDVEPGESVIWDGEGTTDLLDGNKVEHVRVRDIVYGNAEWGIVPVPWNNAQTSADWKVERCEADGAMGNMMYPIASWNVREMAIFDYYCHDLNISAPGILTGRHNSVRGDIFAVQLKGCRVEAPYGMFLTNELSISIYNNTFMSTLFCIKDNGGVDALIGTILNNIFYGVTGTDCICIETGATLSRFVRIQSSDGNCYFPGTGAGGEMFVTADNVYSTLAELQNGFGLEANSINADPLLTAELDLEIGSPCRQAGVCNDYAGCEGNVRAPSYIDIGACQPTIHAAPYTPTLDNIVNDGNGTSVTLTITPPAAGDYESTLIFYKRPGVYEAWSSGGLYVGAQGVAGNIQVSGLNNNQIYMFILVAENHDLYSLPSIPRSVLVIDAITPASLPDFVTELATRCAARFSTLVTGVNCFANHMPDVDSDSSIVFFTGTGGTPGRFDDAWLEFTVQILVTGPKQSGYNIARNMIRNIENEYHGFHNWYLPSFYISTGERIQPPYPLGRDEKGREQFVFNMLFKTREL